MSTLLVESEPDARCICVPDPRGPITDRLFATLKRPPGTSVDMDGVAIPARPLHDDDLQLALYVLYEIHYAGVEGVDERWEWDPGLLRTRALLEEALERALAEAAGEPEENDCENVGAELQRLVEQDDGPSLSRYMESQGTLEQM